MCPSEGDWLPALQGHQKAASHLTIAQSVTKFSPCLSLTAPHLCCPKFWIKTGYDGACLLSQHPGERDRTVENLRLAWTIHSETLSSKKPKTNKQKVGPNQTAVSKAGSAMVATGTGPRVHGVTVLPQTSQPGALGLGWVVQRR